MYARHTRVFSIPEQLGPRYFPRPFGIRPLPLSVLRYSMQPRCPLLHLGARNVCLDRFSFLSHARKRPASEYAKRRRDSGPMSVRVYAALYYLLYCHLARFLRHRGTPVAPVACACLCVCVFICVIAGRACVNVEIANAKLN